jgi:hypothetical protein
LQVYSGSLSNRIETKGARFEGGCGSSAIKSLAVEALVSPSGGKLRPPKVPIGCNQIGCPSGELISLGQSVRLVFQSGAKIPFHSINGLLSQVDSLLGPAPIVKFVGDKCQEPFHSNCVIYEDVGEKVLSHKEILFGLELVPFEKVEPIPLN